MSEAKDIVLFVLEQNADLKPLFNVPSPAPNHIKKNTYSYGDTSEGVLLDLSFLREVKHLSFFLTRKIVSVYKTEAIFDYHNGCIR